MNSRAPGRDAPCCVRAWPVRSSALVAALATAACCSSIAREAPADRGGGLPDALAADRRVLEDILRDNIVPFWYPSVVDAEAGGYRLHHDAQGKWLGPADKHLVTQARTAWFFSRLSRSRFGSADHLAAAKHGIEFLTTKMWDAQHGGFYWAVDAAGERATVPVKHLYGQSFGLYALSEYARASGDAEALQFATGVFALLDTRAYDERHGGYRESFAADWTPLGEGAVSPMGLPAELKLMNTHLHLLEAMTAYVRASGNPLAKKRLTELLVIESSTVIRHKLTASTDRHGADWSPLRGPENERVSYGHDLENIWLLLDACEALDLAPSLLRELCVTLADDAVTFGMDARGGFFESGPPRERADRRRKTWWVQAEALVGTLWAYRLTGDERFLRSFRGTLQWVSRHQVDRSGGDWHANVLEDGTAIGAKAGAWKSPYHNGRAMLRCLEILDALGADPGAKPSGT